jgi:hypothetical protein
MVANCWAYGAVNCAQAKIVSLQDYVKVDASPAEAPSDKYPDVLDLQIE